MHDLPDLTGATIAFDLDGTLVDTAPDLVGTLNTILAEEGLPPLPFAAVRMMVGRGARALLMRGFEAVGKPLASEQSDLLLARFIDMYLGRIADESQPFPGAEAALAALRDAGARLTVCTNKPTHLSVALLDALGLSTHFGTIVGLDAAPAPKPDPRHLFAAIERAGGDVSRALLVGDSETDVSTARNAGLPIIAVTFGYTEVPHAHLNADAMIDSFEQLPAAVARLL
jgi:phosphoglycolate phosphatase